jgi:alpha-1,6-mannosyltransferase
LNDRDELPGTRSRWLFSAIAALSATGYAAAVLLVRSDNSAADFRCFLTIFLLLGCLWGFALWLGHRTAPSRRLILTCAVLYRVLLIPAGISLETRQYQRQLLYDDDVWRYLWEGHAWPAGVNPMRTSPEQLEEYDLEQRDPALHKRLYNSKLWSDVYDNIGYRQVASPYPYAAQAVFRMAGWIAPGSVLVWKLIIVAFDLAAVWLLAGLAGPGARGSLMLLAYAWNPLVIKEFAGSGHVDAVFVCLLIAALTAKGTRAGLLLGVAALVKPVALLFAPAFYRRSGWRGLLGPAAAAGLFAYGFPEGLRAYAEQWTFNPAIFRMLPGGRPVGMVIGAAVVCAVMIAWFRKDDGSSEALRVQGLWLLGAFLLMTPMFAPWYLTWLLPLAALQLSWFWLALSVSIFLSYHAYLDVSEIPALALIEFALPFLLWVWLARGKREAEELPARAGADRKTIFALSSIVGLAGGLCCVTPIVLVTIGVASVSTAAAFGNVLYGDYRWGFRLLGLAILAGSLVRYFRKQGVCTLDQVKRRRNWLVNVSLLALIGSTTVYTFWTYVVVHYWGIAAGLPWAQYDESWAIPVSFVLCVITGFLFFALRRSGSRL